MEKNLVNGIYSISTIFSLGTIKRCKYKINFSGGGSYDILEGDSVKDG